MHLPPRQLDLFRAPASRQAVLHEKPATLTRAGEATAVAARAHASAPEAPSKPRDVDLRDTAKASSTRHEAGRPAPALEPATATAARPRDGQPGGSKGRTPEPVPVAAPPSRQQALGAARVLAHQVAALLGSDVKVLLSVHDNRSTMISFRREPPLLRLRVHHLFLEAPHPVVEAIADYAGRGKRAAGKVLDEYIAERQERIRAEARRASALSTRGACFDLAEVFDRLNQLYFQDTIRARIGWGRNARRGRRKSIRLGVYDHRAREIRVHPALDRPDVPLFFVEYIVFHEMLHQVFPSARDSGRHVHHPRAFRDRERAFPRYAAALAWEKEHLHALLRR